MTSTKAAKQRRSTNPERNRAASSPARIDTYVIVFLPHRLRARVANSPMLKAGGSSSSNIAPWSLGSVTIVPHHGVVAHWLHYVMDVSRPPPGVRPQADVDLVRMG